MKRLFQSLSWVALAGTLAPPVLLFAGWMTLEEVKTWLAASMVVWFATVPFWMEHKTG